MAEIGPSHQEVRLSAVPVVGHNIVQSEEGAGSRRTVVVPDVRVVRIGAEARGAFRNEVELRRCGQICFGGKDFGASFSGFVRDGCDDPGVVAGDIEKAVKFANIGGAKTIIVVYDDVKGDGSEGKEGKERGQGVGGWETHVEGKQMPQCFSRRCWGVECDLNDL